MTYSIPMALEDFLPVILSGLGLYFISQMINGYNKALGKLAFTGTVLIVIGGLSKAVWKLIIASSGVDLAWLNSALFVFLTPGFTCMAWAIWSTQDVIQGKPAPKNVWLVPLVIIALAAGGAIFTGLQGGRTWFFILLGVTTLTNTVSSLLLARQSWQQGLKLASLLFVANLLAAFILSGMARAPQTISMQWTEQTIQTLSQGAFAFAAWQLLRVNQTNSMPSDTSPATSTS